MGNPNMAIYAVDTAHQLPAHSTFRQEGSTIFLPLSLPPRLIFLFSLRKHLFSVTFFLLLLRTTMCHKGGLCGELFLRASISTHSYIRRSLVAFFLSSCVDFSILTLDKIFTILYTALPFASEQEITRPGKLYVKYMQMRKKNNILAFFKELQWNEILSSYFQDFETIELSQIFSNVSMMTFLLFSLQSRRNAS